MKISSKLLLICTLAVGASLGTAGAASACYSHCVLVSPSCSRCESAGFLTGFVCYDVGACGCKELPGVCPPPSGDPLRVSLSEPAIFTAPGATGEKALCQRSREE